MTVGLARADRPHALGEGQKMAEQSGNTDAAQQIEMAQHFLDSAEPPWAPGDSEDSLRTPSWSTYHLSPFSSVNSARRTAIRTHTVRFLYVVST
ncbi:hypothetical protein RKD41_000121 [Streptomyces tendae]